MRFLKEYANYKRRQIQIENEDIKIRTDRVNRIERLYRYGLITVDDAMKQIADS